MTEESFVVDPKSKMFLKEGLSLFQDGVYFNLPADEYHADPALGSTSLKSLIYAPLEYWFGSPFNPLRAEEEPTHSQIVGTAFHTMVLDGPEAFLRQYSGPAPSDYMRKMDEICEWIKRHGKRPAKRKSDAIKIALSIDPNVKIADLYYDEVKKSGKILLNSQDWTRIIQAAQSLSLNPALANAVKGGYREVSIFWTQEVDDVSVRRKARFDFLKPRAIVDLKSITPGNSKNFRLDCIRAIANWRYDIQAQAYIEARKALKAHVDAGNVFGEHDREWLKNVAANDEFSFVFVFWANSGAPLTWVGSLTVGNPVLKIAEAEIEAAIRVYAQCVKQFDAGSPWAIFEPLCEIYPEDLPLWMGK